MEHIEQELIALRERLRAVLTAKEREAIGRAARSNALLRQLRVRRQPCMTCGCADKRLIFDERVAPKVIDHCERADTPLDRPMEPPSC